MGGPHLKKSKKDLRTRVREFVANVAAKARAYFREVAFEMKKVIWPSRKDLITFSLVVIVIVVVLGVFFGVFDFAFLKLVDWMSRIRLR